MNRVAVFSLLALATLWMRTESALANTTTASAAESIKSGTWTSPSGKLKITVEKGEITVAKKNGKWEVKVSKPGTIGSVADSDDGDHEEPVDITITGDGSTIDVQGDGNHVENESSDTTVNLGGDNNTVNVDGSNNKTNLGHDAQPDGASTGNKGSYGDKASGNSVSSSSPGQGGNTWTDAHGNTFPW